MSSSTVFLLRLATQVSPTEAQEFKFQSLWDNVYFIQCRDKGKRGREKGGETNIETEVQREKEPTEHS